MRACVRLCEGERNEQDEEENNECCMYSKHVHHNYAWYDRLKPNFVIIYRFTVCVCVCAQNGFIVDWPLPEYEALSHVCMNFIFFHFRFEQVKEKKLRALFFAVSESIEISDRK